MYMCTLISRGDLLSVTPNNNGTSSSSTQVHLAGPPTSGMNSLTGFQSMNDLRSEMDDSKIDDDLGKLLQHIKEEHYMVSNFFFVFNKSKILSYFKVLRFSHVLYCFYRMLLILQRMKTLKVNI